MVRWPADYARLLWLISAGAVYFALSAYQLGLPGLHYDEAKEAGINAMELISGAPVTAFRGGTVDFLGIHWPLMVQDYIGALNVYLAAPILALTGIGVPNLRMLPVLTGLLTLFVVERAISEWIAYRNGRDSASQERAVTSAWIATNRPVPISLAGLIAVTVLAVSPTYIFWSRQGIFVTNLTQPLSLLCVWQGVRWMRTGRPRALVWSALGAGLALYAKLLAVWIIGPFLVMLAAWWLFRWRTGPDAAPTISLHLFGGVTLAFLLPLLPLVLFNVKTGGTFSSLLGNARLSYYGVDNRSVLVNLIARMGQLSQVLRGDQFWYLGGIYGNPTAPFIAFAGVLLGLWRSPRCVWPPVVLAGSAVLASVVTITDLFVTHYALLYPFLVAAAAIGLDRFWFSLNHGSRWSSPVRTAAGAALALWIVGNLMVSVAYHRALSTSGGLADHSDATYHLAYYLRYNGLVAPIVLDWGIEAPARFLSQGTVRPIEIFGYESLDRPDDQFRARLDQFLSNPHNVYLMHAPGHTVFQGRRDAFMSAVEQRDMAAELIQVFGQRDGQPLYEVWRTLPAVEPQRK